MTVGGDPEEIPIHPLRDLRPSAEEHAPWWRASGNCDSYLLGPSDPWRFRRDTGGRSDRATAHSRSTRTRNSRSACRRQLLSRKLKCGPCLDADPIGDTIGERGNDATCLRMVAGDTVGDWAVVGDLGSKWANEAINLFGGFRVESMSHPCNREHKPLSRDVTRYRDEHVVDRSLTSTK